MSWPLGNPKAKKQPKNRRVEHGEAGSAEKRWQSLGGRGDLWGGRREPLMPPSPTGHLGSCCFTWPRVQWPWGLAGTCRAGSLLCPLTPDPDASTGREGRARGEQDALDKHITHVRNKDAEIFHQGSSAVFLALQLQDCRVEEITAATVIIAAMDSTPPHTRQCAKSFSWNI